MLMVNPLVCTKQQIFRQVKIESICKGQDKYDGKIEIWGKIENIVGKGQNIDCQHFFLFPQCFKRLLY